VEGGANASGGRAAAAGLVTVGMVVGPVAAPAGRSILQGRRDWRRKDQVWRGKVARSLVESCCSVWGRGRQGSAQ
jgi:hypothetical protein